MLQSVEQSRLSLRSYSSAQDSHSHAYHQVVLPLEGRLEMETEVACDSVDETKAAVITAGREHAFRSVGDNRFLILDVPERACGAAEGLWDAAAGAPFLSLDERLRSLLLFARLSPAQAFGPAGFRASLGNLILQGLVQRAEGTGNGALGGGPDSLLRATAFIHRRFVEPITTREIAAAAGVGQATLHRLFTAWHGRSPARYLGGLRLARARALLSGSRRPIAEIALDCGFSEQSALTRALRREAGVTPAQYRRQTGRSR